MHEDPERCYRVLLSRDKRFDGAFVVAVTSTGIYCRPSCPAQTPKRSNVRFYPCAAAAVAAGFRACKRCAPEAAPGSRDWDVRGDLAARALRAISAGVVDEVGVPGLARRLAVSERHLHRLLVAEIGAGPLALARTRRAQTARLLLDGTDLPASTVAFSAGFASIRQFNDTMREQFGCAPTQLRRRHRFGERVAGTGRITLRLPFRAPYDATAMLGWLATHRIPGVEEVDGRTYRRALRTGGTVALTLPADGESHVTAELDIGEVRGVASIVAACRRLLDLDADPVAVGDALGRDALLAAAVRRHPGLRIPGAADGFEAGVAIVLSQQVSVAGARTLLGRVAERWGKPLDSPAGSVTHQFPDADVLADADLEQVGLTRARAGAVRALAAAVADKRVVLEPGADRDEVGRTLLSLPGIGRWTVDVLRLRALADPDVFPATDLALRRRLDSTKTDPARWRPWRSYAAMHLWLDYTDPKEAVA